MSGSWGVDFSGIGSALDPDLGQHIGFLSLVGAAGPTRMQVEWRAAGASGTDPLTVNYAPQPDGSFAAPGPGLLRSYLDGDYTIRVGGYFSGGTAQVEYLTAFFGLNGTIGVTRSGNHLDNLMSGGTGADVFSGAGGKDWLFGGFGGDRLSGGEGDDVLGGGANGDTLLGGNGTDLLAGDDGDDRLDGGGDRDVLRGGAGEDTLSGNTGDDDAEGEAGHDSLSGGDGNDLLHGDFAPGAAGTPFGNDTLNGGFGSDTLTGGVGNDRLAGQQDNDSLVGGSNADTLTGDDGDDTMEGGHDGDRLTGGTGADWFEGGAGADTLLSSADGARDTFAYLASGDGGDRISGFEHGVDKILLDFVPAGSIDATDFFLGYPGLIDAGPAIIYDRATMQLVVDLDGGDTSSVVAPIAVMAGRPTLSFADFIFGS